MPITGTTITAPSTLRILITSATIATTVTRVAASNRVAVPAW